MAVPTVSTTQYTDLELIRRGKVRDVHRVDDERLLLIATDRISAFDCVMKSVIPNKGRVLTQLSRFWFEQTRQVFPNHMITGDLGEMPESVFHREELCGRSMLVTRTEVFPVECVVRGYLEGSGWRDYRRTGEVCGHNLPSGLKQCEKLPSPLFTPATKAESGHDENITEEAFNSIVGAETGERLKQAALDLYTFAAGFALERGIIIADTKFEFGRDKDGRVLLIDEALTPDSSRFWPAEEYKPGAPQPSFDKQFLREYLESADWDKRPPAPMLPGGVVEATEQKYLEAYRLLTGRELPVSADDGDR